MCSIAASWKDRDHHANAKAVHPEQRDGGRVGKRCNTAEICRNNGRFTGFPALGVHWQRMESRSLKEAYKLSGTRKGVLVRQIVPVADAARHLQPYDIIMKFDGVQVACDGTVPFRCRPRQSAPSAASYTSDRVSTPCLCGTFYALYTRSW